MIPLLVVDDSGFDDDVAAQYLCLTGEPVIAPGHVLLQHLVFQHRAFAHVLHAGNDTHHAGAAFAFATAVGDAGADLFGDLDQAGTLTVYGRRVVGAYRRLEQEREQVLKTLSRIMDDFDEYYHLIRRFDMKTSARNQFLGSVKSIKLGQINAEVIVDIGGGDSIAAVITNESVEHLALKEGAEVYAMVKAPWVIVTTSDGFKTSARNELHGTVVRCQEGAVNGEVIIELAGGKSVAAVVTNDSIRSLGLAEGVKACALIKASHVILAVNA